MTRLKEVRTTRGWTQQRLIAELHRHARHIGAELPGPATLKAQVSRWENGHQQPDARYSHLLKLSYGLNDIELGFVEASIRLDNTDRPRLTESLDGSPQLDQDLITTAAIQTEQLRTLDRKLGARQVLHQTRALASSIEHWLRYSTSPPRRAQMARVLADCSALAGWQALDLDQSDSAWNHFEIAKAAAREARDPHLETWTGAEQAYVLNDLGRHHEAIDLLDHHRDAAKGKLSPVLTCWLAAASAELASGAGQVTNARAALDQARLAQDPDPDLSYVVLDESHIARWRGHVLAQLGDARATAELSQAARTMSTEFVRARASLDTDLAIATLRLGDRDLAIAYATTARHLARQIGSARVARRLSKIAA